MNPESFFDVSDLRHMLAVDTNTDLDEEPVPVPCVPALDSELSAVRGWASDEQTRFRRSFEETGRSPVFAEAILRDATPMASVFGCWVHGLSAPAVFDDEVHLGWLSLLSTDVGVGRPHNGRCDEYQTLLRRFGLTHLVTDHSALATRPAVSDEMFHQPAVMLALSRRSDAFAPELSGMDLVFRSVGLMPCWAALRAYWGEAVDWGRLDLGSGAGGPVEAAARSRWCADRYRDRSKTAAEGVGRGVRWARGALRNWSDHVLVGALGASDPNIAMAELLRNRSREAAVYHGEVRLLGRPLASWLSEAQKDPYPLLAALAGSWLIRPGESSRSVLTNAMIAPDGPMFRVFSDEDLMTIRTWIDAMAPRSEGRTVPRVAEARAGRRSAAAASDIPVPASPTPKASRYRPAGVRDAYFVLQGRALPPEVRGFAVRYVDRWLTAARHSIDRTGRSLPRVWTPRCLRPWLLDQHDRHADEFTAGTGDEIPSREAIIDSTVQLAPLTLIDGAWLQGFSDVALATSKIGAPLFQTYWDELGDGDTELNHPLIYRSVLREMGVDLPSTGSRAFSQDPRLRDESFLLPVYWLALGKLPVSYTPEILGLNLAMELSGVGGSYRSARRFLRHYGFSTRFVDIHNTIDNVSTGHSAWAADAIDAYMQQSSTRLGGQAIDGDWLRIRTGYESLRPSPTRALAYASRYRFGAARRSSDDALLKWVASFRHEPVEDGGR